MAMRGCQVGIASRTEAGGCIFLGESRGEQMEQLSLLNVERSSLDERPMSDPVKGETFAVVATKQNVLPMPLRGRDRTFKLFRLHVKVA